MTTLAQCESIAATLTFPTKAFIGGEFVSSLSGETITTVNPATAKIIADYACCGKEDVDFAVSIARRTFDSGVWSRMHPAERKKVLFKFADIIERESLALSVLETIDSGKPVGSCISGDLPETLVALRWHAECIDKRYGSTSPSGHGALGLIEKEAVGVVACIVPWNFPLMTTMWKIAPALAEGNSVIVKPAEATALSTLRLAELAAEAGIPAGVLQIVTGRGSVVGEALGLHHDVDCISFTGSTKVGRILLANAAKSNLKKIILELGGKSPLVLLDDVQDISSAVENALASSFWNTGQNCTANTRIIVPNARKEEFIERMVLGLKTNWSMGNPLDPRHNMGTMITKQHFANVNHYIQLGLDEGIRVATGGTINSGENGLYIEPTIFVDPARDSVIMRDEIFGPVTSIIGVDSNEEALSLANDTEYGLQASLFTNDLRSAHKFARALRAGTVSVNSYNEGDASTPFGGFKLSGFGGQDKAMQAHDQYCNTKTIFINLD